MPLQFVWEQSPWAGVEFDSAKSLKRGVLVHDFSNVEMLKGTELGGASVANVVHWFRNDLRLTDNPALEHALLVAQAQGGKVACVFCHDQATENVLPWGAPRMGPFRKKFLLECLAFLKSALEKKGIEFFEISGLPASAVLEFALEFGATLITFQSEVAPDERGDEGNLLQRASQNNVAIYSGQGSEALEYSQIFSSVRDVPDHFTSFRTKVEKHLGKSCPGGTAPNLDIQKPSLLCAPKKPNFVNESNSRKDEAFRGGEDEANARLRHYLWETDCAANYFETRNGMLCSDDSTRFSRWLAFGCISAHHILLELQKYEQERCCNKSTYWIFFELLWRDFFRLMALKHGANLFKRSGIQKKPSGIRNIPVATPVSPELELENFALWRAGQTSVRIVNACMKELSAAGWLSNRGRQIAASYLIHQLGVRWTWGAWHFESQLVDYDASSNWGNWAYHAGVGNDPRGTRIFDPVIQAQRYDPEEKYVRFWTERSGNF